MMNPLKIKIMKKFIIVIVFASFALFIDSCGNRSAKVNNDTKKAKITMVIYTCDSHPDVVSTKPGKCPKCGEMDLIKKEKVFPDSLKLKQFSDSLMQKEKLIPQSL
jgi:hypothetical protein